MPTHRKFSQTNPENEEEIRSGGKTGTAEFQKGVDAAGDPVYDAHAWFTMFAPFDKPEFAISVFIESGGEGFHQCGADCRQGAPGHISS